MAADSAQLNPFLGVGIYSIAEAAKLTRLPSPRVSRWLRGYRYVYRGEQRASPAIWEGELEPIDGAVALGFLDLMELRFVDAFLREGVSLRSIRLAIQRAAQVFATHHPFCRQRFKTDGRTVFLEVSDETGEKDLLDLVKNQYAFDRVLRPYLRELEYSDDEIVRWWPLGRNRRVVVDPSRSFGKPVTVSRGVPTSIIAKAVQREGSVEVVMKWFRVERREILDAVQLEEKLAA